MALRFRNLCTAWGGTLRSVASGLCVCALGGALTACLASLNVHGWLTYADNILSGIAAGLLVLFYEHQRNRDEKKKLRIIDLMNHYVRNALQVISAASDSFDSTKQQSTVREAVRHIEWALREVLPGKSDQTDNR